MATVDPCEGCGVPVVTAAISGPGCERSFEPNLHGAVPHYCRDYLVWHAPADSRDPHALDVPYGWVPRQRAPGVRAA